MSSSLAGLPLQARTLSGILGAPGQSQSPPAHKMNPEQQQQHLAQGKQAGYGCTQPQLSERQQQTAVSELDAVSLGGIPIAEPPQQLGGGYQQYQQQPQQQQQDTRMMSVDMMDVSNLSLNSPQPMHIGKQLHAGQYLSPVPSYGSQEPQRSGSADEERAREKLREAQEQVQHLVVFTRCRAESRWNTGRPSTGSAAVCLAAGAGRHDQRGGHPGCS